MVAPVGSFLSELDTGATNNLLSSFDAPTKDKFKMSRREEIHEMSSSEAQTTTQGSDSRRPCGVLPMGQPPAARDRPAYLIRWNRFEEQVCNAFAELFCSDHFVDVTLACEGELLKAHKIVLAMSSPFFRRIFQETPCKHPVVIIKGMTCQTLKSILQYLYMGEVVLNKNDINNFMEAADYLSICGVLANLYSCDISSATNKQEVATPTKRTDQTEQSSTGQNEDTEMLDTLPATKSDDNVVSQSGIIKYHGVKSRWRRRYSNTSFHGTPTAGSPVLVEQKRSASAGELELSSDHIETLHVPESKLESSKATPPTSHTAVSSDADLPTVVEEQRFDEGAAGLDARSRKIIQRAYPKDYGFDDSSDTQMEEWRPQSYFHSSHYEQAGNVISSPSARPVRPAPYHIGGKDFSHPLQVAVDSHSHHSVYAASSSSAADQAHPKLHSTTQLYSSPQALPHHRGLFRQDSESEYRGSASQSPITFLTQKSKDERALKYRTSTATSTSSSGISPSTPRHHDFPQRSHFSLLATHAPWAISEARARPYYDDSDSREVSEGRPRTETIEGGPFSSFGASKDFLTQSGHLRKPHSFPSGSEAGFPVSQQLGLGFHSQLRSPSTSVTASTSRPKTKAIRSSQVPQSSRYTAAEVDQMVEAVANYPGNIVPCTLCQKFVKRERLRAHIHECHLLTGEKIICPHCGIALKSKGSFRVHIWRHKRGALPTRNSLTEFGKGPPSPPSGPASH